MTQPACAVVTWQTLLRADEALRFTRCVPWGDGLWFCEWHWDAPGRLVRDIVLDGDEVWTKEECDV